MSGWQPIATADTAGGLPVILGDVTTDEVGIGLFDSVGQCWRWHDMEKAPTASHWMPVPELPE